MTKPDFDRTLSNIRYGIAEVLKMNLKPARVYMNYRTFLALNGIFQREKITYIPDLRARIPTIYGVKIAFCDSLPDEHIEVAVVTTHLKEVCTNEDTETRT